MVWLSDWGRYLAVGRGVQHKCGHTTHNPREVIALTLVSAPILLPAGSSQPRNGQERAF